MKTLIVIEKETILVVESWLTLFMTIASAAFFVFDIAEHGILFRGSLVPLLVGTLTAALFARAERRKKFYEAMRSALTYQRAGAGGKPLPRLRSTPGV